MSEVFAVIEIGGKQYPLKEGEKIRVDRVKNTQGEFRSSKILLLQKDQEVKIGTPHIEGAEALFLVEREGREKKKIIFKYHSKTRYRKKKGHRQPFTELRLKKIELKATSA